MKKLLNLVKTGVFLGAGTARQLATNGIIQPAKAHELIASGAVILDVRGKAEIASGMLPNAIHIPHTEVTKRAGEITADLTQPIVIYCAVGGRAAKAQSDLLALGYQNVFNAGGYKDLIES